MLFVDSDSFDGAIRALAVLYAKRPQRLHVTGWAGLAAVLWVCKIHVKVIVAAAAKATTVTELLEMLLPVDAHARMSSEPVTLLTCWYVMWNRAKPMETRAWATRAELIATVTAATRQPAMGWGWCSAGRHSNLRYSRMATYVPFNTGQRLPAGQGMVVGWFGEGVAEAQVMERGS